MIHGGRGGALFADLLQRLLENSIDVLDIGTNQRFAKELRPFETWFAGKKYMAAGYFPQSIYEQYNCDCHQDIESMSFSDASFDAVICLEVLEHVKHPAQAVAEILRVLRPGGKALVSSPFLAQYHGKGSTSQSHESYPDFWRFTHEGLAQLFSDFRHVEMYPVDGPVEFRLRQFYLGRFLDLQLFRWILDLLDRPKLGRATTRHLMIVSR